MKLLSWEFIEDHFGYNKKTIKKDQSYNLLKPIEVGVPVFHVMKKLKEFTFTEEDLMWDKTIKFNQASLKFKENYNKAINLEFELKSEKGHRIMSSILYDFVNDPVNTDSLGDNWKPMIFKK